MQRWPRLASSQFDALQRKSKWLHSIDWCTWHDAREFFWRRLRLGEAWLCGDVRRMDLATQRSRSERLRNPKTPVPRLSTKLGNNVQYVYKPRCLSLLIAITASERKIIVSPNDLQLHLGFMFRGYLGRVVQSESLSRGAQLDEVDQYETPYN